MSPPVWSAGQNWPAMSYSANRGISDGSVLIWISRASLISRSSLSAAASDRDMRSRWMKTTHCAARVSATRSSSVENVPLSLSTTCSTPDELRPLDERNGQHAADVVVDVEVDGRIEERLALTVGNVDDLARTRGQAEDALRERGPERRNSRRPAGEDQHALVRLEQPDGSALPAQHAARSLADLGQHLGQFERSGQLARHLEDLQQGFGA